jgi:hypothetical protein
MGLPRKKDSHPRSPTIEELDKLPQLEGGSSTLSVSAPYKVAKVSQTWDPEEGMGDGFSAYFLRRIKQYGLPFVGLSILLDNPRALEWNRRTATFCSDTFYHAVQADDYGNMLRSGYNLHKGGLERAQTLIKINLDYRIAEMKKHFKRATTKSGPGLSSKELAEQKDRRYARRVAVRVQFSHNVHGIFF